MEDESATTEILTEIKKVPILRVITLMAEGLGKYEACAEVGISHNTFDRTLARFPDLPNEIIKSNKSEYQIRYEKVQRALLTNFDHILQKVDDPELTFRERLSLDDKLTEIKITLEKQLGIGQLSEEKSNVPLNNLADAQAYLNREMGVRLRPGTGKITQTVEFDIERMEGEIIEGEEKVE
jgi:hypothetical protein